MTVYIGLKKQKRKPKEQVSILDLIGVGSGLLDEPTPNLTDQLRKDILNMYHNNADTLAVTFTHPDKFKYSNRIFKNLSPIQHYRAYVDILQKMLGNSNYIFVVDYNKRDIPHLHGIISFNDSMVLPRIVGLKTQAKQYFDCKISDIRPVNDIEKWLTYLTDKKTFKHILNAPYKYNSL